VIKHELDHLIVEYHLKMIKTYKNDNTL